MRNLTLYSCQEVCLNNQNFTNGLVSLGSEQMYWVVFRLEPGTQLSSVNGLSYHGHMFISSGLENPAQKESSYVINLVILWDCHYSSSEATSLFFSTRILKHVAN
jgi:hypothetical protein